MNTLIHDTCFVLMRRGSSALLSDKQWPFPRAVLTSRVGRLKRFQTGGEPAAQHFSTALAVLAQSANTRRVVVIVEVVQERLSAALFKCMLYNIITNNDTVAF